MIISYDWESRKVYMPIGVRVGKVVPSKKSGSWNFYAEVATSLIYDNWPGAAKDTSIRLHITKTLPASF
jgi:hypothetical protein